VVLSFTFKGVKMNFKPIRDRIIIRLLEAETATKSGIIIPDAAQEKPSQGEVVAAGPGRVTEDGVLIPTEVNAVKEISFSFFLGMNKLIKKPSKGISMNN
jgi:chaperonin GroES